MKFIVLLALILVALIVGGLFFLGGTGSVAPTTPGADGGDGGTAAELTGERTDAGSDPADPTSIPGQDVCGDGDLDAGEECDDGNTADDDACPSTCQNAICGDGFVRTGVEECDDGGANSDTTPDACRTDCTLPVCGDDVLDSDTEECDDGNNEDGDGCDASCALEGVGTTAGPGDDDDDDDDGGSTSAGPGDDDDDDDDDTDGTDSGEQDGAGDEGCGCATERAPTGGEQALWLAVFALALGRRRRRS